MHDWNTQAFFQTNRNSHLSKKSYNSSSRDNASPKPVVQSPASYNLQTLTLPLPCCGVRSGMRLCTPASAPKNRGEGKMHTCLSANPPIFVQQTPFPFFGDRCWMKQRFTVSIRITPSLLLPSFSKQPYILSGSLISHAVATAFWWAINTASHVGWLA